MINNETARSRLLEAALAVFGQKGLDGTTVREIAAVAGQNVAAISYYFGSKEALYRAAIEAAADEIQNRLGEVFSETAQLDPANPLSPEQALALIQRFLRTLYLNIASRQDALAFGKLVMREQMEPTSGYDILYERCFRQLHEKLALLLATVLDTNANEPDVIIRVHSMVGQVFAFRVARETIRRRLGWESFEGENAERVAAIIEENVDVLLRGLRSKRANTPLSSRSKPAKKSKTFSL